MKIKIPKITIYDIYIFKQVLITTSVAILLFMIVWIAPETLLNTIREVLSGMYGVKTGILGIACDFPKILDKAFPVGLLLGSLFTFDKLSKDSELTIFRAVGMSFVRIIMPVVFLSLIVTYMCFIVGNTGIPKAAQKANALVGKVYSTQYIYTRKDTEGHPLVSVIVSKSMDRKLQNVIVLDFASHYYQDVQQLSDIYTAKTGYAADNMWELSDVTHYQISNEGIYQIGHIDKIGALDGIAAKNAYRLMLYSTMKDRDITTSDLKAYVKLLKQEKLSEEYHDKLNKYLQRFTHPLVCVLLAILGCILGFSKPREQRLVGFVIAIGFIFAYYITAPVLDLLASKEVLSPYLTSTLPLFAFAIAIYFFYKTKEL